MFMATRSYYNRLLDITHLPSQGSLLPRSATLGAASLAVGKMI